jgi:hypothetical protein
MKSSPGPTPGPRTITQRGPPAPTVNGADSTQTLRPGRRFIPTLRCGGRAGRRRDAKGAGGEEEEDGGGGVGDGDGGEEEGLEGEAVEQDAHGQRRGVARQRQRRHQPLRHAAHLPAAGGAQVFRGMWREIMMRGAAMLTVTADVMERGAWVGGLTCFLAHPKKRYVSL